MCRLIIQCSVRCLQRYDPLRWPLLVTLLLVLCSGCSNEQFKRMAYFLSTSYSCTQSNNHKPNEGVKDLECTNPATSKAMSYEDYKNQRAKILKQQN